MTLKHLISVWENSKAEGVLLLVFMALADSADDTGEIAVDHKSVAIKARIAPSDIELCIDKLVQIGELMLIDETDFVPHYQIMVIDSSKSVYRDDGDEFNLRIFVLNRDRYICRYCGGKAQTVDHIIPSSRGGKTTPENLVACCKHCNSKKGDRMSFEAGMELRS